MSGWLEALAELQERDRQKREANRGVRFAAQIAIADPHELGRLLLSELQSNQRAADRMENRAVNLVALAESLAKRKSIRRPARQRTVHR